MLINKLKIGCLRFTENHYRFDLCYLKSKFLNYLRRAAFHDEYRYVSRAHRQLPTIRVSGALVHSVSRSLRYLSVLAVPSPLTVNKKDDLNMSEKKPFQRLPKNVLPKHYDLELTPDLKTFTFDGKSSIKLSVTSDTREIVLNSLDLDIKRATLSSTNSSEVSPTEIKLSVEDETVTLVFAEPLAIGESILHLEFTGEINDKMKGFYRSKYVSPEGEERYAGVTQFEATDARRCFPCWDEPAIKATFDITLVVPKDRVALSNMPVKTETTQGDNRTIKFGTTPIMSTYLVAIVVGEYDYVEDTSKDGVLVRVYTPVGKKEQGMFALEVATRVLPYYKDYFNIAYPLPKIDLIAIADFSAGAMENWGLVTYRETCLLVDPHNTSAVSKQWIALVVGHELAHQWFGNLVTMEWWTHLWLNEGYATFVEFLCVDFLFPEYDIWTQFVTETYIRALELDCLKNSHPIEVPVGHPAEIDEIFDDISYNKGASVIRMLHRYIGDEDFRKGMNLYLTRHQYNNTFTEDLWAALEEASNKPVGAVMSSWTKQMGFPVVQVSSKQSGNDRILTLSQEKFCADGSCGPDSLWMVPVSISIQQNPDKVALTTVLENKTQEVVIKGVSEKDWFKVNPGAVGYYRTRYTSDDLARLVAAVRDQSLPPLDRLGLLDDLFAMVQAGHTPTVESLKLMDAFNLETNFTVWSSIANCLSKLSIILSHTDLEKPWKYYCRKLFSGVAKKLGWNAKPNEPHLDTLLRSLALNRMITFEDPDTIAEAKRRFNLHISGETTLPADLRSACYKAVLLDGDESTFTQFLELFRSAELHEEKDRISRSFGVIKDVKVLEKVLQFAMSGDVRSQDTVFVIMSVAHSRIGRTLAWEFFKTNWKLLIDRYQGGFLLARLVKCTTENFASEAAALEVEEFFKTHCTPGAERTVQQSLETIRLNAAWLARDLEATTSFLSTYE